MNIDFDVFGEHKPPVMTLHNPNGKQIAIISVYKDLSISPNIGTLPTLNFKVPYDENIKYYKKLRNKRLIKVEGFGQFKISSANDESDGITRYMTVTAQSLECELNDVIVTVLEGTYKLWNSITPSDSLLGKILAYLPNWSVGEIDDDLRDVSRTFQEITTGAYGFLMSEVSNTYECMFLFDTFNRTIKVKTYSGVISKSDIIAGYSNLVKKLNIEEKSDGIFTCLNVTGANDLSINLVNPLGTSKIYNFKYYMEYQDEDGERLMSDGLIAALTSWNNKFQNALLSYGALLTSIKNANKELVVLNGEVTTLEGEYLSLEGVYKSKYEQGLSYTDTWNQMQSKQVEIDAKKTQVTNKENQLSTLLTQKTDINNNLSLTNASNFTILQQNELALFTIEDSYTDEHFLTTDIMTEDEIQDMAQSLYDKAVNVLDRVSQPTYSFSIDMVNFMLLGEYKAFTKQVKLGTMIKLEIEKGRFAYPVLLGYTLNFDKDKCSNVTFDFGSTLLLKSDATNLNDLLQSAITSGNKVTLDSNKWSQYDRDKGAVNEFINGTLDASKNPLVNAANQEIKIGENGIIGRKHNDDGTYSPEQLWIMNNTMAYTKNSFQTIETAFGKVQLPDGTWSYGLVAQAIMGKLLITSQLHLENTNNSFLVNESGATLRNASFTLETTNGKGKIILDPANGIKVQGKTDGVFEDKFYVDTDGNLNLIGKLIGATGTFSGDLKASNLIGGTINIGNDKFKVDNLGNCTASSLNLNGGSINVNNRFTVDQYGNSVASSLTLSGGNINIGENFIVDSAGNCTTKGNLNLGGNINMTGKITWDTSSSPVKAQYSIDGSSNWHSTITSNDKFARYSYDGGITWTSAIKIKGEDGTNGSDGINGSDAFVPEYITQTYIDSVEIKSPKISGNVINSATFNGGIYRTWDSGVYGGQMDSMGLHVYDGTTQIGDFTYTNANANGNPNALLINSKSGYAMKLNSSNNMSLSATNIYLEGRVIINGMEISSSNVAVFG